MAKFHIAKDGRPAACRAEARGCPLGADTPHGEFESADAAVAWAENYHMQQANGNFSKPQKKGSKVYAIDDVRIPVQEPGEDTLNTGWVTQEMIDSEGKIDPTLLDDNYGFPKIFENLKFTKSDDGTFKIIGSKAALESWLDEDEEGGMEPYELDQNDSTEPKDPTDFSGTSFEELVTPQLRILTVENRAQGNFKRAAPTYTISRVEKLSPEAWAKLADDAEAEQAKVEELRRGFAEEKRKSNAYFPTTPKGSNEADLKSRELSSLAISARNAAYIASEKKLPNGETLQPGEVLISATFSSDGKLLGYGDNGKVMVDGEEVKFSRSTSSRGKTILGVVATKGVIDKGHVVPLTQNLDYARVLESSTSVNIAASNPYTEPTASWFLGKGTPHGIVQGQPYFEHKTSSNSNGFDSVVPIY